MKAQITVFVIVGLSLPLVCATNVPSVPKFNTVFFKDFTPEDAAMLEGKLTSGVYILNISVNGKALGNFFIVAKKVSSGKGKVQIAIKLPNTLIRAMHAKTKLVQLFKKQKNYLSHTNIQYVSFHYNYANQSLNITVPQAYLFNTEPGVIAPSKAWSFGVAGGSINYMVNGAITRFNNTRTYSLFDNVSTKYNLGRWQFYTQFNNNIDKTTGTEGSGQSTVSTNMLYLYGSTIFPAIRSKLSLGYNTTNSPVFGGLVFYGATLNNEMQMLPQYEQSFKPVVQGVVQQPTTLALYQGNQLIYKKMLNPGPYNITDYNPIAAAGNIREVLTGANGKKQTIILPYQAVASLIAPGVYQYRINAGCAKDHYDLSPFFVEVELHYGLNNYFSPYAGLFLNNNYAAVGSGTAVNLGNWGGLDIQTDVATYQGKGYTSPSNTVTKTITKHRRYTGVSIQISYTKALNSLGTAFSVIGYLYQSKSYVPLNTAFSNEPDILAHNQNEITFNVNQQFTSNLNAALVASYAHTWDDSSSTTGALSVNYTENQYFNWALTYQQSLLASDDSHGQINRSISLTLTYTPGVQQSIQNTMQYNPVSSNFSVSPTYFVSNKSGRYSGSIGMVVNHHFNGSSQQAQATSFNAGFGANVNQGSYSINVYDTNVDNYSINASATGGIIYTPQSGLMLTRQAMSTFAVINTHDVSGISIEGVNETNGKGFGLDNGLIPYYYNSIQLSDTQHENGRLTSYEAYNVPIEGAILYESFKGKVGQGLFVRLGEPYANATKVLDTTNHQPAAHVYGNLYYFDLVRPNDSISVYGPDQTLLTHIKLPKHLDNIITVG